MFVFPNLPLDINRLIDLYVSTDDTCHKVSKSVKSYLPFVAHCLTSNSKVVMFLCKRLADEMFGEYTRLVIMLQHEEYIDDLCFHKSITKRRMKHAYLLDKKTHMQIHHDAVPQNKTMRYHGFRCRWFVDLNCSTSQLERVIEKLELHNNSNPTIVD